MKNIVNNALKLLFNKVTFLTILINWIFIILALYERGNFNSRIHFFYEPLLFNIVFALNILAIGFAETIVTVPLVIADYTLNTVLMLITSISLQWWIIGCAIKQIFFNNSEKFEHR